MTGKGSLVHVSAGLGLASGGVGVVARLLAGAAAEFARGAGISFRVLSLGDAGDVPDLGFPVESFGGSMGRLAAAAASAQVRGRSALLFDHVGPARVQALLPGPFRSPYAVYLHGIEVWRPLRGTRLRALARASRLLANSRYTVKRACTFGLPDRPVRVVPPVLEERGLSGTPDARLIDELGRGFLLIAGRMSAAERYKGHDELIEAFPAVRASCPEARLVVAGGGDDRDRLAAKAASLGLGDSIRFAGFVSEATLAELFRRAAAFVMPSRDEGFGLVYLEAMRAGIPSVALRDTAPGELIEDGASGLLVPAGDRPALAAALVKLLADAPLRAALGERAGRTLRERYAPASFRAAAVEEIEALCHEAVDVRH